MNYFNKKWYYILNFTWGLPMNLIGAIVALALILTKHKPKKHCGCIYFEVGKSGWGGLELGCFFLCSPGASLHTKNHEYGHSLQNALWGPLFPFVIAIPSAIRYHYRNLELKQGYQLRTQYDDIWFEGQATKWGTQTKKYW